MPVVKGTPAYARKAKNTKLKNQQKRDAKQEAKRLLDASGFVEAALKTERAAAAQVRFETAKERQRADLKHRAELQAEKNRFANFGSLPLHKARKQLSEQGAELEDLKKKLGSEQRLRKAADKKAFQAEDRALKWGWVTTNAEDEKDWWFLRQLKWYQKRPKTLKTQRA